LKQAGIKNVGRGRGGDIRQGNAKVSKSPVKNTLKFKVKGGREMRKEITRKKERRVLEWRKGSERPRGGRDQKKGGSKLRKKKKSSLGPSRNPGH